MIDCSHSENPLHKSLTDSLVKCFADEEKGEQTILVPITAKDELDQDTPDPNDELAAELSMLQQKSKSVAIIGSRNIPLPHQQIVEMLAFSLTHEGNQLITSGGSSGTNAAAIRGAMRGNPDLLKVILPQTIGQQPSDVQDQLIGIPHIIEHPEWSMMKLADASRLCNREIIDEAQQLVILLTHDSPTLQGAIEYAEENHKIVTTLYLD
ncbi:MAG TPA: DNA recombination-mediator protein A [Coleofasciculaceae cyanobacterium]